MKLCSLRACSRKKHTEISKLVFLLEPKFNSSLKISHVFSNPIIRITFFTHVAQLLNFHGFEFEGSEYQVFFTENNRSNVKA